MRGALGAGQEELEVTEMARIISSLILVFAWLSQLRASKTLNVPFPAGSKPLQSETFRRTCNYKLLSQLRNWVAASKTPKLLS